jgi:hypothetical protein
MSHGVVELFAIPLEPRRPFHPDDRWSGIGIYLRG